MTVIAFTPYGREATVSVLLPYLRREFEKGTLDEWWLCINVDPNQKDDLRYAYKLSKEYSWIKLKDRPPGTIRLTPKQRNTGYFYQYMTDPDAIYLRFDDDIIYVHEDAITNLVTAKRSMPTVLTCFGLIWNNAICSWYLQKSGVIPTEFGEVERPYCMDPVGWASGEFAVRIHEFLLDKLEAGGDEEARSTFLYFDMTLAPGTQFSVSNFAVSGRDYCELKPPGHLDFPEEEAWHTVHRPQLVGKSNIIVGNALVSHYTFYPQSKVVKETDILDRYRALSEKV